MITNFEQITSELNQKELAIVPTIVEGFKRYTKENPIKAPEIVRNYNARTTSGVKLNEPRLRKICNYIRSQGLLPLIATSEGYYVSYEAEEIQKQIKF